MIIIIIIIIQQECQKVQPSNILALRHSHFRNTYFSSENTFISYSFQRGCGKFPLGEPPDQFPPIKFTPGEFPPGQFPGLGIHQGGINRRELTRGEFDRGELVGGGDSSGGIRLEPFQRRSHVFIYIFEQISCITLVFSILTLYK